MHSKINSLLVSMKTFCKHSYKAKHRNAEKSSTNISFYRKKESHMTKKFSRRIACVLLLAAFFFLLCFTRRCLFRGATPSLILCMPVICWLWSFFSLLLFSQNSALFNLLLECYNKGNTASFTRGCSDGASRQKFP